MLFPTLAVSAPSKATQMQFGGYNHNLFASEGEFYDMENLSSLHYPIMSPREKRKTYTGVYTNINGMITAGGKLLVVDGTKLYYNGVQYSSTLQNSKKKMVRMGAYVAIWPDKKLFNTSSLTLTDMGASFTTTGNVVYTPTNIDGDPYNITTIGVDAPEDPANGDYWIDTSDTPHVLKQYSSVTGMWISVPTVYTKIASLGIGSRFQKYDGVHIAGDDIVNGDFVLQGAAENYIIVTNLIDQVTTRQTAVTVSRTVPDMDYVCELNNRLWGCSSENHEIYACKLGDPTNWYSYVGISTDSYAATIGSDGDFTGCIAHLGYVLFFKEDIIHRVYGTKPSNFQITDIHARGVEKGSESSLCIVNETLYYKSRSGICAYDGGLPAEVGLPLGLDTYKNANAGALGNRYYLSMQGQDDVYHLFVYDESLNLWYKEDETQAENFINLDNGLYYLADADGDIHGINGAELPAMTAEEEDAVEWFGITGDIAQNVTSRKYISRLQVRIELSDNAEIDLYIQYDGDEWRRVFTNFCRKKRTFLIPIIPRRADSIRLKFKGRGGCRIFAVSKYLEEGSED